MMPREGAFHHLIIVSYPRQDKRSKGNGCAIQPDFMLLTVSINLTSKALQSPKIDLENAKSTLNSTLTSIENLRNNFANIKEEAIGFAKKWGITPKFEKKTRKVRQFFDDFNADEKLQDRERLFEVDVFKANVDVITTQLKNRFESMNGIYKSSSFLSPKNIVSTTNDLLYNEASNLQKGYSRDLSSEFPNQIMSLKAVFSEDLIKLNSIKDL
ncbi:uncharacterized protein TNCV_2644281 [Trichonephila clavipes]|nr:uncharacterized protein TNCV_2644281 [Trichonephila clavipes]